MLLGRYSHSTGIETNLFEDLTGDRPNVVRALRAAGYRTCHIGKTHLATGSQTVERFDRLGFEDSIPTAGKIGAASANGDDAYIRYLREKGVFEEFSEDYVERRARRARTLGDAHPSVLALEDYHDEWISRQADAWLQAHDGRRPFYLSVNWAGPHAFRDAPGEYASMYDPKDMDPPIDDPMELAPAPLRKRREETLARLQADDWRKLRASYYGMLSLIDDGIGRLLKTLENLGRIDNTLIIYTADHGEMLCDHGLVYKTAMYEPAAGVPLIIRGPGCARNIRPRSPVSLVDLSPTLLAAAGAPSLEDAHGCSLMPVLSGEKDDREQTFSEFQRTCMIRRGPWKYVCDPQWDVNQLFHIEDDPTECRNRIREAPDIARDLHARIDAWLAGTP